MLKTIFSIHTNERYLRELKNVYVMYLCFIRMIYICGVKEIVMATFTSTLPDPLLQRLAEFAQKLNLPKNKLIERALELYLDQLNKAEYVRSYRQAGQDVELMMVAEEGMAEYLTQLNDEDAAG
jgi:predicted transcriptional regulator